MIRTFALFGIIFLFAQPILSFAGRGELRTEGEMKQRTFFNTEVSDTEKDRILMKLDQAHLDLSADADIKMSLKLLKDRRKSRDDQSVLLQQTMDVKREAIKNENDSEKKKKIHSDISNAEAKFASFAKEAKADFVELKKLNDSLKQKRDTALAAVLTPDEQKLIESSDPNYFYQLDEAYMPNDADLTTAWHLRSVLTQEPNIFASVATQEQPIIVAVIDSGVEYTHPDLQGKMWSSLRCIDETGALKATACTNGYDFIQNDADPAPTDGQTHGTAVAGLLTASTDNGIGIASLSQNRVQVMSLRVFDGSYTTLDVIVKAVYFAVNNGAQIINMSLSGPNFSQSLSDAIAYAETRGVTIVTTAGNTGSNIDTYPVYPAAYQYSNVIAVAATDRAGRLASFSSYGPATVDIAAPGVSIYTTMVGNVYGALSGTSFSAPIVASYLARGLSEGKTITDTFAQVPASSVITGIKDQKVLGAAIQASDGSEENPFTVLDDGSILDIFAKGGEILGSEYTLDCTTKCTGDPTLGKASQISPGNKTLSSAPTISGNSTTLVWNSVSGAVTYGVYLTNHDTKTRVIFQENRSVSQGTSVSTGVLSPGTYRWNTGVSKTTTTGTKVNLTPVWYFKVGSATPAPSSYPSTITPSQTAAPGAVVSGTSQSITWSTVTNASSYKISIRDTTTGALILNDYSQNGTSYTASGLVKGHYYKFDMLACNTTGCSSRSPNHYFYVPAAAPVPSIPTGIVPSSVTSPGMEVSGPTSHRVTWTLDTDATSYSVAWREVTSSGGNVSAVWNQNVGKVSAFTITGLSQGKYYTFDITACNSSGCTTSGNHYFYITPAVTVASYDVVPSSFSLSSSSAVPGASLTGAFVVKNIGTQSITTSFKVTYYLAAAAAGLSEGAQVGESTIGSLAAGQTLPLNPAFTLPAAGASVYSGAGEYKIWAKVDSGNVIPEGIESNNKRNVSGIGYAPLTLTSVSLPGQPQISISTIGAQTAGVAFPITLTTSNISIGTMVYVKASVGDVTPTSFKLTSASLTKSIMLLQGSTDQRLTVTVGDKSSVSNYFNVQDPLSSQSTWTVRVKDIGGVPIANAKVTLRCLNGFSNFSVNVCATKTTDDKGITKFNQTELSALSSKVGVVIEALGKEQEFKSVYLTSLSGMKEYTFPGAAPSTVVTPVILVPGIMGSTVGWSSTLPYLPGGSVDAKDLSIIDTATILGWKKLRDSLTSVGYEEGKTIIDCPYDWRISIDKAAQTYFKDCVDKALASYPADYVGVKKVDVIAHSMGGLVARDYIQSSTENAAKIRKLAFVGTPQNGATDAYYIWEGGDVEGLSRSRILAKTIEHSGLELSVDTSLSNSAAGAIGFLLPGLDGGCNAWSLLPTDADTYAIYPATYKATKDAVTTLKIRCPGFPDDKIALNFLSTVGTVSGWVGENNKFARGFIHINVPSGKQLIPTYEFLHEGNIDNPTTTLSSANQNEFLLALNGSGCADGTCDEYSYTGNPYSFSTFENAMSSSGMQVKHYYSESEGILNDTKDQVVYTSKGTDGLYEDGVPKETQTLAPGDATVPFRSVKTFLDSNPTITKQDLPDSSHEFLIRNARYSLTEFVSGVTLNSTTLDEVPAPTANFSFTGQVQVRITDPAGRTIGIDPVTGAGSNTIAGAEVSMENGNNVVSIPNPLDGSYKVEVSGPYSTGYSFSADYNDGTRSEPHEFNAYHVGSTTDIHVLGLVSSAVSPTPVYTFYSNKAPMSLKASPSTGMTKLNWSAPEGTTPTSYRIYTKATGDSSVTYVGQTSGMEYTTAFPFAGASTTLTRQFFVSSVLPSGTESFLSLPELNNDTDGDGIGDITEGDIGTNPALMDTDSDGLTEGQEYYLFRTNPLAADSDSDGISDYTEVTSAITAAIASSTATSTPVASTTVVTVETPKDRFTMTTLSDTFNIGSNSGEQGETFIASSTYTMNKIGISLTKGVAFVSGQNAILRISQGVGAGRTVLHTQTVPLVDTLLPAYSATVQPEYLIALSAPVSIMNGQLYSWTLQIQGGSTNDQLRLGVQATTTPSGWAIIVNGTEYSTHRRAFTTIAVSTTTVPVAEEATPRDIGTFATMSDLYNLGADHAEEGQSFAAGSTYTLSKLGINMARGGGFVPGGQATLTLYRGYGSTKTIASTQTFSTDIIPATSGITDQTEVQIPLTTLLDVITGSVYSWAIKINSGHTGDQIRLGVGSVSAQADWNVVTGTTLNSQLRRKFTTYGLNSSTVTIPNLAPSLTKNGTNPVMVTLGDTFMDPGAIAIDPEDGLLSVTTTGTVNLSATGTYVRTYTAIDSKGVSVSTTRTIKVVLPPLENKLEIVTIPQINDSANVGTSQVDHGQTWVSNYSYDLYKIGINLTRGLGFVPGANAVLTIARGYGSGRIILATTTFNTSDVPASGSVNIQPEFAITLPNPVPLTRNNVYSWTITFLGGSLHDQLRIGVANSGFVQNTNWGLLHASAYYQDFRRAFTTYGKENLQSLDNFTLDAFEQGTASTTYSMPNEPIPPSTGGATSTMEIVLPMEEEEMTESVSLSTVDVMLSEPVASSTEPIATSSVPTAMEPQPVILITTS